MKNIANRIAAVAAATLALGTIAFAQTRMIAEIPFAFRTSTGVLPAGTYSVEELKINAPSHVVYLRNSATGKGLVAGTALFNSYGKAADRPAVDFVCGADGCALKAIRTREGALVYQTPHHANTAAEVAVISIDLKAHNGD